ncbi:MAG: class I SAM-dependent methyltransferase [Promethearchaeota archaeon]
MANKNSFETNFIKVKKEKAQALIKLINKKLKKKKIINQKINILHEKDDVLFPLINDKDVINYLNKYIENKIDIKFITKKGIINQNFEYKSIQDYLEGKIPDGYSNLIPKSYDIIGNIVIIEFDKSYRSINNTINLLKIEIAKAIININKKVKSVYEKKSKIKGKYRLRELNLLYGENKSETIYKENNCVFKLDIKKTYFTPRLVNERNRISSSKINNNEIIIDMFAGVGPISIQIAKKHEVRLYSFDVNPNAYKYLKENIKLNKLKGVIYPYNIDIKNIINATNQIGRFLCHKANRIIMNLPEKSINFFDVVCFLMKRTGGILHNYQFCEKPEPIKKAVKNLNVGLKKFKWIIETIFDSRIVKAYSPISDLVAVDLFIKPLTS